MRFSIITAVFNNKDLVKSAIESVQSQVGVNIEHIIMDGGSTDGTVELIKSLNIPNLLVESAKDKGIYDALNKGMKKATGDILGILHSDDFFNGKDALAKVHSLFEAGADVVYADLDYVLRDDPTKLYRRWKSNIFSKTDLRFGWVAPHPAFFIRTHVFKEIGDFNLSHRISGDYDFILRVLLSNKYKISYLPEIAVKMRVGGESNKSFKNILKGSLEDYSIAKKHFMFPALTVFSKVFRKIPQLFIK